MDTTDFNVLYTNVTTNTMNFMDNVVPCFNITKVLKLLTLVLTVQTLTLLHTEDIVFRQEYPLLVPKAEAVIQVAIHYVNNVCLQGFVCVNSGQLVIAKIISKAPRLYATAKHDDGSYTLTEPTI